MRAIYSVAIMATAVTVLDNATVAGKLFSNAATRLLGS